MLVAYHKRSSDAAPDEWHAPSLVRLGMLRREQPYRRSPPCPARAAHAPAQRASFAHDASPAPTAPLSRKCARVAAGSEVSVRADGVLADAGLALGRSRRVCWGPAY
jgi:hypothetical protein